MLNGGLLDCYCVVNLEYSVKKAALCCSVVIRDPISVCEDVGCKMTVSVTCQF